MADAALNAPRARIIRLLAITITLLVATVGWAYATGAGGLTANNMSGNDSAVGTCDTDGVTVVYTNVYSLTVGDYQVTSIVVNGINSACVGRTLRLTIKNGSKTSLYSSSAAAATSVTFTPTPFSSINIAGYAVSFDS
jgi:hypothetical protein